MTDMKFVNPHKFATGLIYSIVSQEILNISDKEINEIFKVLLTQLDPTNLCDDQEVWIWLLGSLREIWQIFHPYTLPPAYRALGDDDLEEFGLTIYEGPL